MYIRIAQVLRIFKTTRIIKHHSNSVREIDIEMTLPKAPTKEGIRESLKSVGKLRLTINRGSVLTIIALLLILFVAFTVRMLPLRWEIQVGTIHLSEFDPYFQYSLTNYMVKNGLISPFYPTQWVDTQRWAPTGINMAMTLPGLPITAAFFYDIISALGISIDLMSFCAIFAAILGTLSVFLIYFLGKDFGGKPVGLFAALFLAFSPSFIQRTSLGFFDDETLGIVALLLFALFFLRAVENERSTRSTVGYSLLAGLGMAYFISDWGAAYYLSTLAVLFVLALVLMKRYSRRLFLSYSITFGLALFITINIPYLNTGYLLGIGSLPVAAMFIILCLVEVIQNLGTSRSRIIFGIAFFAVLIAGFAVLWQFDFIRGFAGKFVSVLDPFARSSSPLIESVAEHRITAWGSIYYEFGIGIVFFIAGIYFIMKNLNNRNLFLLLFGLTSLYFASSMVRLLVLMAPAFGLLGGIGIIGVLKPFNTLLKEQPRAVTKKKYNLEHVSREFSAVAILLIFLILMTNFAFTPQAGGVPKVFKQAYSPITITAGSLPIVPDRPVQEWFDVLAWTKSNLGPTAVVSAWWDYGYWLTILGNVTSLCDNATINATSIENVGFMMMSNESYAIRMMKLYNSSYLLVFTSVYSVQTQLGAPGTWAGYGDEGKWTWMAKISGQARDDFINQTLYPTLKFDNSSAWTDETPFATFNSTENKWNWTDVGKDTTIYKLMNYGKEIWCTNNGITNPDPSVVPTYFEPAYFAGVTLTTSESYGGLIPLVLLYRVNWDKFYADFPNG